MKYTLNAEQSINNIMHNLREIKKHLEFKKEIGEGFDENYMQLARIQDECQRQLGEWYFIQQEVKQEMENKTSWNSPLVTARGGYAR